MSIRDQSEAKRIYGGGVAAGPMGTSPASASPSDDEVLFDAMSSGKPKPSPSEKTRASSAGGRVLRPPTSGSSSSSTNPLPPKLDDLDDFYNKQIKEFVSSAKKVLSEDDFEDFKKDEEAQIEFAEAAAVKSYADVLNSDFSADIEGRTLPDGTEIDVTVFGDGSEYYVDEDADEDNLQPGDVIRLQPRSKKYR